jgi:predicted nucleotidyltransferase
MCKFYVNLFSCNLIQIYEKSFRKEIILLFFINILLDFKNRHADHYGITRMGIFGSVARGEQMASSDLDICVEMKKPDMFLFIGLKGGCIANDN